MRSAIALAAAALCLAAGAAVPDAAADARGRGARVAVWPQDPGDDVSGVEAAVRAAGFQPVSIEPVRARLRAAGERASAAEAAALDEVQQALAAARASYLAQDFAAMAAVLAKAELAALGVLAQPRHAAVLWEVQLQRGLAELARGDAAAAKVRFAFALAIDEARTPRRELYGPAVARAFAEVADARPQIPPRPVPLRIEPRDARVAIDGLPVADTAAPRLLRPGLHAVLVTAPGYVSSAAIVELRSGEPLAVSLAPAGGDAVERLGAAWAAGAADAGGETGRRAIAAVVAELGAVAAVVVDVDRGKGEAAARVIEAGGAREGSEGSEGSVVERRATAAAAAAAALAHLAPDGSIRPEGAAVGGLGAGPGERPGHGRSLWRSWWFWTAVGAGVVGLGAAGYVIDAQRDRTIRVLPPAP